MRFRTFAITVTALSMAGITPASAELLGGLLKNGLVSPGQADNEAPAEQVGAFSEPFAEPTIMIDGDKVATDERCLEAPDGRLQCKPAAGTLALTKEGNFLYLNALEGTENVELSIIAEFGQVSVNDQSRILSFDDNGSPHWTRPTPVDGGANADGRDATTLLPGGLLSTADTTPKNSGALFCADVANLANGGILAVGGTDYYSEVGIDGLPVGVVELEGLKDARIFHPETNSWTQSGSMKYGRWYPTLVTLANGDVFVASGVTKLLKPVYPEAPLNSGRNVVQTETYDLETGDWRQNGRAAQRSLPLFPRMKLLPNGHVIYLAGGQSFNPFGQAYDQALWNIVSTYDPVRKTWTDLAYAGLPLKLNELGLGALSTTLNPTNLTPKQIKRLLSDLVGQTLDNPTAVISQLLDAPIDARVLERLIGSGMRGSTFAMMMPLRPDANGGYHSAKFLIAGGVPTYVTVGSPGGYLPISSSRIDTVTVNGDHATYESRLTGPLNQPRWYGSGVLLPDGSVMVFNGGTRDGVVLPGLEGAIRQAERFDPQTETWTPMAMSNRERTYHNTAVLMPDGRVLIGGHSPINTAYLSNINLNSLGFADYAGRDPSFEIYTPPYALRDDRPVILSAPGELAANGETFTVVVDQEAVDEVMLIRQTVTTHLVDGDQRAVVLPIVRHQTTPDGIELTVRMTGNRAVAPAGPYMLFVSKDAGDMRVPSKSSFVHVTLNEAVDTPNVVMLEPAETDEVAADENAPLGGLLGELGDGGLLRGSPNNQATGGRVSPLLPVTDLASGVLGLLPTPRELATGSDEFAGVLGDAGKRAGSVLVDTVTSLPEAGKGLLEELSSIGRGGDRASSGGGNDNSAGTN